jgi:hypothetical protein
MIGVNVAKAEKIIWMVYAEIKAGVILCYGLLTRGNQ